VDFPDGRRETFAYGGGKLASITEVGVGGAASRLWTYTWSGDDLIRVSRPDGTAYRFEYGAPLHPGYLTKQVLVGTDASERIEAAWEYDDLGNVVRSWKGAAAFADAAAAETIELAYDTPALPRRTDVTLPIRPGVSDSASYAIAARAAMGEKPRITAITGGCPACGSGPNSQFFYEDGAHPFRVTREIDGRGHVTVSDYDSHGQRTSRTEAFGTARARTTTWSYSPAFPALATRIETPSTSGGAALRVAETGYDGQGAVISRIDSGVESGSAFSLATAFTPNAGGQTVAQNPPEYGTADVTSWAYDPAPGNGRLVLLSRTDPLKNREVRGANRHRALRRPTSSPHGLERRPAGPGCSRALAVEFRTFGAFPAGGAGPQNGGLSAKATISSSSTSRCPVPSAFTSSRANGSNSNGLMILP
jgi:YD repeat-containing protein